MTDEVEKNIPARTCAAGDTGALGEITSRFRRFALHESCGKCVPCREGSKRMLEVLERAEEGLADESELDLLEALADTIMATALCGLGKHASRLVLDGVRAFRGREPVIEAAADGEKQHPEINPELCRGCGKCRRGCPMDAIDGAPRAVHVIDPDRCVNCGACVSNCPFGAVRENAHAQPEPRGVMIVDGIRVPFDGESNVLAVIRKAGIDMPTFCYYSELSVFGACRMCVVEDERGVIDAACSMVPRDGKRIRTNTARLLRSRRMILELMLASHQRDCTACQKSVTCKLQRLALRFGMSVNRFPNTRPERKRDESSPSIVLDENRCILCGDCVRMCDEVQGMGILQFLNRGSQLRVTPAGGTQFSQTDCVNCGQCAAVCPTGAIFIRNEIGEAWRALHDPKLRVVVQVAPAVRVGLGDAFGMKPGENVLNRIVAALHIMGADQVYDTAFGADLTVMEEAEEFLERLEKNERLPLFTSCCPAWVSYVKSRAPDFLSNLSSCRSPMQMLAAVLKDAERASNDGDPRRVYHIALMPCTAKKAEAVLPELRSAAGPDVDLVLTTQEFGLMVREAGICFDELEGEAPDMPFGYCAGAGVIFGASGGVAEAVVRQIAEDNSRDSRQALALTGLRGDGDIREAVIPGAFGRSIRVALVNGLGSAKQLLDGIRSGALHYDIVEVMGCRGGCVGGAGQPPAQGPQRALRAAGLYEEDRRALVKQSEYNPVVQRLYTERLMGRSEQLLHRSYE